MDDDDSLEWAAGDGLDFGLVCNGSISSSVGGDGLSAAVEFYGWSVCHGHGDGRRWKAMVVVENSDAKKSVGCVAP